MGVHDFETAFDRIDNLRRGYVTADQIRQFHSCVYDDEDGVTGNVSDHVRKSIDKVCGKGTDRIFKDSFFAVLEEIERRRSVYSQAYWDFMGLDYMGSQQITLHSALILFEDYHGEQFSLDHWHKFVSSREYPGSDVCLDEVRDWLCDPPSDGSSLSSRDVDKENERLDSLNMDFILKNQHLRNLPMNDDLEKDEQREREDNLKHTAKRKLNKWKTKGLKAMLQEEGVSFDDEESPDLMTSDDKVSVHGVLELLENKYAKLQEKIFTEMAEYAANMDSEKSEILQQLTDSLKQLYKDKELDAKIHELPGANVKLPISLLGILGYLGDIEEEKKKELAEMRSKLENHGLDEIEVDSALEAKYLQMMGGEQTCGESLKELYTRWEREKKFILDSLHNTSDTSVSVDEKLSRYFWHLFRQLRLMVHEKLVLPAGLAVGIGERPQVFKPRRFDWDRHRSEKLASLRLEARIGHTPAKVRKDISIDDDMKGYPLSVIISKLVTEMQQRQYLEREALIFFLQGHDSKAAKDAAAKTSPEYRRRRLQTLRNQREEWKSNRGDKWRQKPESSIDQNQKLFQEAVALYYEIRRLELEARNHNVTDESVMAAVLADVQQRQEVEVHELIESLNSRTESALRKDYWVEIEAKQDEHYSCVAYVVLGSVGTSPEDVEYVSALEGKYKALRDQILVFGIIENMGSRWRSLSNEEKKREIMKQREQEKKLRGDGHLTQLEDLIGTRARALAPMSSLVGEDKVFGTVSTEPSPASLPVNLLADLVSRHDLEEHSLLSWLHSDEVKEVLSKVKHVQLARLAVEKFVASSEGDHETALLSVGLVERVGSALSGRSKGDRDRQLTLAQKRAALRKKCKRSGEKLRTPPAEKTQPKDDDEKALQAVVLRALLRRHYKEREVMLGFLQDEGLDELVEAAAVMSPDQAMRRVQELKAKREALDLNDKGNEEEHTFILEEAGAIRTAGKKQALCRTMGRAVLMDEVVAHLLAELQDLQDAELAQAIHQLSSMSAQDMRKKISKEDNANKNSHCHLVMKVFTRFDGDTNTADIEQLIEEKYAKLRFFLLNDCLCQQQGRQAWAKMGQKQKTKLLTALQSRETALWNEGNSESMSACIFPGFSIQPSLPYLCGMGRHQYYEAVVKNSDLLLEDGGVTAEDSGGPETISFIHKRFMAEMDFVKNYVAGSLDFFPSDDDKQLLINKLKWEIALLKVVQDFDAASLFTGLAERQNTNHARSLKNDRQRYELLARPLMAQVTSHKKERVKVSDLASLRSDSDDVKEQQEAVMALLQKQHGDEWSILSALMEIPHMKELYQLVAAETQQQREDRLFTLHRMRSDLDLSESKKHLEVLEQAAAIMKQHRREELGARNGSHIDSISDADVDASLMADLLQVQLSEAQMYLEAFAAETQEELQEDQETIISRISQSHGINIAKILFEHQKLRTDEESEGEDKLKEAVDGKYDALRDQLLIQALINEMGEAEWRRLSEKERQRLLMELKLKERRLRKEGKYDEAAALIGEMLNNDDKIRKLLGDARDEQERKLRERLERRKQRLAQGMSEEECDELEEQEIAQEEEEEQQRKRNILLYLDHCHDKEKEELLRRLGEYGDEHERQRQKQLEMLKLRREQRRLRQEGKFDAAAMLMGLSEENERRAKLTREEEKKRQQDLARQRLEMARLRRMQGEHLVRGESIVLSRDDQDGDDSKLSEQVLRVVDKRHQLERELLIKILDEGSEGDARDEARVMTDDELKSKLEEVQDLYNIWKESETRNKEDGEKILADATVLSIEAKKRDMQADGEIGSDEDVKVALLADLQTMQDGEVAQMMTLLTDTDGERKRQILHVQNQQLQNETHDNVANVLLALANEEDIFAEGKTDDELKEGSEEEEEKKVVKALEKKYDAMKDKLLMEALMRQMGEADWKRLSELERQKKLMEMKREEKRLRKEGKMDEIAALLGNFMDDKKEIDRLLGQSQEDQRRKIAERLALKKKLRKEREAAGESVDEETLEELVEEEEDKIRRHNILENLDHQFEEEKAALLARLHGHDNELQKERERQLAIAKLQREQRRLKHEEKFDSAAMIFAQGKESSDKKQQNLVDERERQRLLAKERLEALKKQRAAGKEIQAPLTDALLDEEEGQETSTDITDEVVFLQDSIIAGLEKHQADERDTLTAWMFKIGKDKAKHKTLAGLSDHGLKLNLAKLQRDYEAWEKKAAKSIADTNLSKLPVKKREKIQQEAVKRRKEQADILEKALQHKHELERRNLVAQHPDMTGEAVADELFICTLADLQEKQLSHLASVQELINNKDADQLREIRSMQRSTHREGWFKTLSAVTFTVSEMLGELHSKEDMEGKLAMDYEQQKKELLQRGQRESIDVDAMLKDLENQYKHQRKAIHSDLDRQREILRQKLAAKKQAAEDKEFDAAAMASQIFAANEANVAATKKAKAGEKGRQDDLLQQRLQARREARKQALARANAESPLSRESTGTPVGGFLSRQGTSDSMVLPGGLSREKTVVDVKVSHDEKQAIYNQLVKQELKRQEKISAQQSRQEDLLKQKLENRSNKRENEVAALFSLGERQKTILEQSQKDERERQIAQMKERVTRMRESRSRSPAKSPAKNDKK